MDAARRALFKEWFYGAPLRGDRVKLMEKTGYSKGRVTQFLDDRESFGSVVARRLAEKLDLPPNTFEPAGVGWPFEEFKEEMFAALTDRQKGRIEKAMLDELAAIMGEPVRKRSNG